METFEAVIVCHSNDYISVKFRYIDENGRELRSMPSVEIPCVSYTHARAVCDNYNAKEM